MKESVFITGMGAISAPGAGVEAGFLAVSEGRDSLVPITLLNARMKTIPLCAQVNSIPQHLEDHYRTLALALTAVEEALHVLPQRQGVRLGIVAATTVSGISHTERFYELLRNDPSLINSAPSELAVHEPTVLSGRICEHVKGCGFHTVSTACSTGLHAIGMAARFIKQGTYDACLAIGADALSLLTIRGFASLMLIDPDGCRPFDKRRAGISLGEGAAAMLLTNQKTAGLCTNGILASVSGWGASADCYHMTAPHPQGEGACRAINNAINEADISAEQIDFVASHGTGTPDNDKAEIKAMQSVFKTLPPFCSMKRTLGHTLAASGILEAVFAVKAMNEGTIPPTAGFEITDEEIGAAPSPGQKRSINHILKNSFGFGGNNAAIVFSKPESL